MTDTVPNILTIAGSDSGGGAGIQADLKTFGALGAYGASVITALTAQNTRGVSAIHLPPTSFLAAQLDAVFSDIRIDAVKIGMLGDADAVRTVAAALRRYRPQHIVLDPVLISSSGRPLLQPDAIAVLRDELLPLATLLTPNLPEAAALLHRPQGAATDAPIPEAQNDVDMVRQAQALRALGAQAVLMKGGHLGGEHSPDWLVEADGNAKFGAARVATRSTHGTGCTLSAAIAALRPQRPDLPSAISDAKTYLTGALLRADRLDVGDKTLGTGPLHHFHHWW